MARARATCTEPAGVSTTPLIVVSGKMSGSSACGGGALVVADVIVVADAALGMALAAVNALAVVAVAVDALDELDTVNTNKQQQHRTKASKKCLQARAGGARARILQSSVDACRVVFNEVRRETTASLATRRIVA